MPCPLSALTGHTPQTLSPVGFGLGLFRGGAMMRPRYNYNQKDPRWNCNQKDLEYYPISFEIMYILAKFRSYNLNNHYWIIFRPLQRGWHDVSAVSADSPHTLNPEL